MKGKTLLSLACVFLASWLSASAITPPGDIVEAMELCDGADLHPIEGLWTYPEDDVTVLLYRDESRKGVYDIFVVEAADCSLKPGMRLGELHSSADPVKFTLKQHTAVKKGVLSAPWEATATLSESKEALTVKRKSFNIKINPTRLLPSFWRIASISLKPNESAPEGMIKLYPSYDGNGSTRRAPRYL